MKKENIYFILFGGEKLAYELKDPIRTHDEPSYLYCVSVYPNKTQSSL